MRHAHVVAGVRPGVSVVFDSLPEIIKVLAELPAQVKPLRSQSLDPARFTALLQQVEAEGGLLGHIRCQVARHRRQQTETLGSK